MYHERTSINSHLKVRLLFAVFDLFKRCYSLYFFYFKVLMGIPHRPCGGRDVNQYLFVFCLSEAIYRSSLICDIEGKKARAAQ